MTEILNIKLPPIERPREMNSSRKLALANGDIGIGLLRHKPEILRAAALYCEEA